MLNLKSLKKDIILAPFTTYKIGGPADYFIEVTTKEELSTAILESRNNKIPYFLLGTGANVLIGDKGYRGLVIHNLANNFHFKSKKLIAESGATIADLIEASAEKELS
ncbi:MAG: FAD-binding protein, partial [bacterium]|nr:FAD-binding protein [bacterium]